MDRRELLRREVYGRNLIDQVTFIFGHDAVLNPVRVCHVSMITEILLEVIRAHEAIDTGYPFVLATRGYSRKEALDFMLALTMHIDMSRKYGNSDYVIEWWNRNPSDSGRSNLIISIAPPGLYELSM